MKIDHFTTPELDYLRKQCNFVNYEITMFEMRSRGHTIEEVAEELDISMDYAYKISQRVNRKIIKIL